MTNVDVGIRLKEFASELKSLVEVVTDLKKNEGADELWDNADMIRNWKVSARTLATWRAEGLIGFVQLGSKIWYPKEVREEFLRKNLKNGGNDYGV
jgi:hypothetical protein